MKKGFEPRQRKRGRSSTKRKFVRKQQNVIDEVMSTFIIAVAAVVVVVLFRYLNIYIYIYNN